MSLASIRESRAAKVGTMRNLLATAESEKRSLNPAEQNSFDSLKNEITGLEAQESRAQFLDDAERRSLGSPVGDKSLNALHREVNLLDVIRSQMEGRALSGAALESHQESERRTGRKAEGVFIPLAALEQRVQTAGNNVQGGYLVGTDHRADQYIEPFRNSLLARKLGVRVLPDLTGNVSISKHGSGCTSGWVAENSALPTGGMTFGNVTLAPRHVGGLVEISRQLIQQSSPAADALVRADLSAVIAQAIDSAIISGGGSSEPIGVLSTSGIQTYSMASPGWAHFVNMVKKLDIVNATATAWLLSASAKSVIMSLTDSTGLPAKILDGGRMLDTPAYWTNQLADKVGAPNTGRILLGDWSQVLLGIWDELSILVNPFESVAYSRGGVLVRAMATCDVAIRHAEAFVSVDNVAI